MSLFGKLMIAAAPPGALITIDDTEPPQELLTTDARGNITIERVPVGPHIVRITKPGFDQLSRPFDVTPGEAVTLSGTMSPAVITLTVNSEPGASIYLNSIQVGRIPVDRTLQVPNTYPGQYRLRVELDGFEPVEHEITLTFADRQPIQTIDLQPIESCGEVMDDFQPAVMRWTALPSAWRSLKSGLLVKGDELSLLKAPGSNQPFCVYYDFEAKWHLRFVNGKGASWILRAKDPDNYYLFELTTSKSQAGRKAFNAYLWRKGTATLVNTVTVVDDIEKPNDQFDIFIEARGPQIKHLISVTSKPKREATPIAIWSLPAFQYGGIGLRGINGNEVLIQEFWIRPLGRGSK